MNNALYKNLGRFDLESDRPTRTLKEVPSAFFGVLFILFLRSHFLESSYCFNLYIQGVSGIGVNILGGGSRDYTESINSYKRVSNFQRGRALAYWLRH
jgi:hypothetical protein